MSHRSKHAAADGTVKNNRRHDAVSTAPAVLVDEIARQGREDQLADTGPAKYDRRGERAATTEVETDYND